MTQSAPAPPEARADRNAEAANSEGPAIGRSKQPDAVKEHYFGPRLQAEFCFAPGFRPLNHGSYGAPPKAVVAAQRSWADQAEGRPDAFLRMYFPAQLPKIRSLVADVVKCDREDLVLVPNATTAMNAVLRSQSFATGDRIVYFSTTYAAIKKLVHFVCQTTPAESVCIELTYPTTTAAILRAVEAELLRGGVKVAIIDTISSMPALRLPFEKLIGLCRQHGCLSLIDGAHGVGAIPIDLKAWHPDYFTSNLHKWYFAPRATALLYVARGLQPAMQSPVISHGWNPAPAHTTAGGGTSNGTVSSTQISDGGGADWNAAGAMGCNVDEGPEPDVGAPIGFGPLPGHSAFEATFSGHGTADVSQVMAVRDAVEFRRRCGGDDVIFNYLRRLAVEGGAVTARILGTEVLEGTEDDGGPMINVRLPLPPAAAAAAQLRQQAAVGAALAARHDTFVPVCLHAGAWWARLSAQIYLDLEDFRFAGRALLDACTCAPLETADEAALSAAA